MAVDPVAHGQHAVPGRDHLAGVGGHEPPVARLVVVHRRDAGAELDVAAQREPVGDVVQVAQDLRLGGVPLGPLPLGEELTGERVAVVDALDVAPGARVAVPEPRAADVGSPLEHPGAQPEPAQPVEHVQAGEPGPHHGHVDVDRGARSCSNWRLVHTPYLKARLARATAGGQQGVAPVRRALCREARAR